MTDPQHGKIALSVAVKLSIDSRILSEEEIRKIACRFIMDLEAAGLDVSGAMLSANFPRSLGVSLIREDWKPKR